jgi:hypothetical protein
MRTAMATEKVHILRSSFLLPFGRLKVGSMPVVASLSNHARALPPELFPKPFPNRGFSDFL